MTSLYNMTAEYQQLLSKDEFTDLDMMEIDKLHNNIEDRIIYYGGIIQDLKAKLFSTQLAIQTATDKKNKIQTNINRIEEYIIANMFSSDLSCVDKSPYFDIKLRNNPISVDAYEPTSIPQEYWIKKEEYQLDKKKVKEDIENLGLVIPGVKLQRKVSLQIK